MSWHFDFTGTPKAIVRAIGEYDTSGLSDDEKSHLHGVRDHITGLLDSSDGLVRITASGHYASDDDRSLNVSIADAGTLVTDGETPARTPSGFVEAPPG